ncbi:MAG: nucleoside:proton symporter [Pseudomonadales bacterium]|nr:nucleoside:proton symporter [Pseudomonadales bacterium]
MIYQGVLGLLFVVFFAWLISENRRAVLWKTIAVGFLIQFILAVLLLKVEMVRDSFLLLNEFVLWLERGTAAGTAMVFGYLGGGDLPFKESFPGASFVLAFRALPLILVVSALTSVLFYWRVLPLIINVLSQLLQKSMKISGAVSVSTAANVFVGMVEAPLFIKPHLLTMTRSELFIVMSCGMATVAGTVMVLYASILAPYIPNVMGHILTASLISAPAAIIIALVMVPEGSPLTHLESDSDSNSDRAPPNVMSESTATSTMDAITQGTESGLKLLLNVIAMLIVLVALVSLLNQLLGFLPELGGESLSLQRLLGVIMSPVMWLLGVPWAEAQIAGALMGTKTVLNEFVAYLELANLPAGTLSEKSRIILLYAMCGFANFGSLGIMIAGLTTMAPSRRTEIVELGGKAIVSGTLATCMTGAIAGLLM